MADEGQQLVLTFQAQFERYLRNFEKAQEQTDRRFRSMEQRAKQASDKMNRNFANAGAGIANVAKGISAAFAGIVSAKAAQDLLDSSVKIQNQLKITGLAGKDLTKVYDALFDSAQRNATPLEALVTLYSRTSGAAKDLGANQQDLLKFTDGISLAMRVSGQSAAESAGALLQLSQALGGGKIQAEEYNSLLDAGRPILKAVASGMVEAGGSISNLTRLVKDGEVSSQAFFRAFLAGMPVLQSQVASSGSTISGAFVRLQNVLIDTARRFDQSSEASRQFAGVIDQVSAEISAVNFDNIVQQIETVTAAVNNSIVAITNWAKAIGQASGLSGVGKAIVDALPGETTVKSALGGAIQITSTDAIQSRIDSAFGIPANSNGGLTADQIRASAERAGKTTQTTKRLPAAAPTVAPIKLADYPVPDSDGAGKGSSRGGGGGRDRFASELQQLQQRTTALQSATAAQAALNPLVEDYGQAVATAQAKQELMNAAQAQNKTVTPEMAAQIDAAAAAYGRASAAAQQLQQQQDNVRRSAEDALGTARDVTKGLISDLMSGKSGAEALSNALAKIGDAILNNVLDKVFSLQNFGGIFGGLFGGGGQAALAASGSIFGLFADGGYTGDGGKHEPAGVVHRGEVVWSQADIRRAGGVATVEAMRRGKRGYAEGGYVGNPPTARTADLVAANTNSRQAVAPPVNINTTISVNGSAGTPDQNADLAKKISRQMEQSMKGLVADELRRQTRPGNYLNQRGR